MKTLFTSMLLLVMTVSQAITVSVDSSDKGKSNPSANPTPSTISVQQLQEENANLKARLATLETTLVNETALLEFKITMKHVLVALENEKQNEKLLRMESLARYNELMGTTLLKFKSNTAR